MKRIMAFFLACTMLMSMAWAASPNGAFSEDITDKFTLEGKAEYQDYDGTQIQLTRYNDIGGRGRAIYQGELPENFMLTFEYRIGGNAGGSKNNEGGNGITVAFFADQMVDSTYGEKYCFDGCGGYGFEIDADNFDEDGKAYHAAFIEGTKTNHLAKAELPYDIVRHWSGTYRKAQLIVSGNNVTAFVEGKKVLSQTINMDKSGKLLCFAAYNKPRGLEEIHAVKNVVLSSVPAYADSSDWAISELDRAAELGLIPEMLLGADMTRKITRMEFAALATELYETITQTTAEVVSTPFNDVSHDAVAKAYGLGITGGVAEGRFAPDEVITREQVATMLTRALKAALPGLDTSNASAARFADDTYISDWAKESVYYMASKGIINGVGNNMFAPKNITSAQVAAGYANSTIEQAIIIAKRAFENR